MPPPYSCPAFLEAVRARERTVILQQCIGVTGVMRLSSAGSSNCCNVGPTMAIVGSDFFKFYCFAGWSSPFERNCAEVHQTWPALVSLGRPGTFGCFLCVFQTGSHVTCLISVGSVYCGGHWTIGSPANGPKKRGSLLVWRDLIPSTDCLWKRTQNALDVCYTGTGMTLAVYFDQGGRSRGQKIVLRKPELRSFQFTA